LELNLGEILLLVAAALWAAALYISPGKRASNLIGYIGCALALLGVVTGYALIGFIVLMASLLASAIVQFVLG
jgi:hypothetical protein